jgi:hypothetical protein
MTLTVNCCTKDSRKDNRSEQRELNDTGSQIETNEGPFDLKVVKEAVVVRSVGCAQRKGADDTNPELADIKQQALKPEVLSDGRTDRPPSLTDTPITLLAIN